MKAWFSEQVVKQTVIAQSELVCGLKMYFDNKISPLRHTQHVYKQLSRLVNEIVEILMGS